MRDKKKLLILIALIMYIVGFLSSYPYLLEFDRNNSSVLGTIRSIAEYSLMFLSFITFCVVFLSGNNFLKIIGRILLFIVSINFMLSASCFFIYEQGFNVGMMMSILDTNVEESLSMAKTLLLPSLVSLVFFLLLLAIFEKKITIVDNQKILFLLSTIWIILPLAFYFKHKYISNKGGGFMIKNITYHSVDLMNANKLKAQIEEIKNTKVHYNLINTEENPVDNIVILMGESVRRHNLSLYGHDRETTPFADAERGNILLYKNAHSPASITNLAVPIALSNIDIDNYGRDIAKLSDNVLNVANHLGYDTFWFSTQGGAHGITAIASFAQNKKWINGFDEKLIPELQSALKSDNKKKLIVLHINGSHPYACDKYPKQESVWNGGIDECYDNSVRYTDKVMGEIFKELKGKSSVLIYLSDHGQIKQGEQYIHGDYREATEIPYFIWFSDEINNDKKGKEIQELTTSATLYKNVLELMGVKNPNAVDNSGKFLKTDLNTIKYEDLK